MKNWTRRLAVMLAMLAGVIALGACVSAVETVGEGAKQGVGLVGKGVSEVSYLTGLADRPEEYDGSSSDYQQQDFLGGFEVKPEAKPWIGRTFSMIRSFKGMEPSEPISPTQQLAVLGKLDSNHDSLVTESEAKTGFEKIRNDLAKATPIDVSAKKK